jgi:pimeloyl-ACP methyl ester carboxylesterase
MGGAYIRLFTSLYPAEVAGLVFIDSPDFMLTDQQDEEIKVRSQSGQGAKAWIVPHQDSLAKDTLLSLRIRHRAKRLANLFRMGYFREYKSLAALPDVPIAVLFAYNKPGDSSMYTSGELVRFREGARMNMDNYMDMIKNNHNSFVMLLPGYHHSIQADDPELVAEVVERIYRKALVQLRHSY